MRSSPLFPCLLYVVTTTGCGERDVVHRPYDTALSCRDPGASPIDTVEQAVARLDTDEDGVLTDLDLRPREGRAALRIDGVHEATGEAAEPGWSVHADFDAEFFLNQGYLRPTWNVKITLGCVPSATMDIVFEAPDGIETLEVGSYPVVSMSVLVWTHEVMTRRDIDPPAVAGVVHITEVSEEGVSGWLEGSATGSLFTRIPRPVATGQSMTVEALAFRDVPIT